MENNKYLLTMIIAKRAKELMKGAKPLVATKSRLPMKIALEEVKAGKVYLKEKEQPLKAEDVFLGEEGSQKVEEPAKVEDISNEVKEPEKSEELSDEDEKPVEIKEIFNENEESKKSEGLL